MAVATAVTLTSIGAAVGAVVDVESDRRPLVEVTTATADAEVETDESRENVERAVVSRPGGSPEAVSRGS